MYIGSKKIYIKNKIRFSSFLTIIFLCIILTFNLIFSNNAQGYSNDKFRNIIVSKGDTLWDIVSLNSNSEVDIRKEIHSIKKINKLDSSYVYPGQELLIPIRE